MFKGTVQSIHITPEEGGEMQPQQAVQAFPGRGLEGDRYFDKRGDVTLIEHEALAALARDYNVTLDGNETRRNIVTGAVPLNHLVGQTFRVGEVRLRGKELCEPCNHLAEQTGKRQVLPGLLHRGGLRAEILTAGTIRVGDAIEPE